MDQQDTSTNRIFYEDTKTKSSRFWNAVQTTAVQTAFSAGAWAFGFSANSGFIHAPFPKSHVGTFFRSLGISVTSVSVVIAQMFFLAIASEEWSEYRKVRPSFVSSLELEEQDSMPHVRIRSNHFFGGDVTVPVKDVKMCVSEGLCELSTEAYGKFQLSEVWNISDLDTYKEFIRDASIEPSPQQLLKSKEGWTPVTPIGVFQEESSIVDIRRGPDDYFGIYNGSDSYYVLPSKSVLGSLSHRPDSDFLNVRWEVDLRDTSLPTMVDDGVLYCDFESTIEQNKESKSLRKYLNPAPETLGSVILYVNLTKE